VSRLGRVVYGVGGAAVIALGCLAAPGCLAHRAPKKVEAEIESQLGEPLERESGVKLGWMSTHLVAGIVGHVESNGRDDLDFGDITGISVVTYQRPAHPAGTRSPSPRLDPRRMGFGDWETVLDIRGGGEQTLALARCGRSKVHEMVLLSIEDDEVVVVRVRGRVDRLLTKLLRGAGEDGPEGARRIALSARP
jgi:hypothetical protein